MSELNLLLTLVDLALFISAAELLWRLARPSTGPGTLALLAHLGAGLALMVALRLSLAGAGLWPVAACLAAAGAAHALDSALRWRAASASSTSHQRASP